MSIKQNIKNDELAFIHVELQWRKEMRERDFGREILESMTYEGAKEILAPSFENAITARHDLGKIYKRIVKHVSKYYAPDTAEHDLAVQLSCLLSFDREYEAVQKRLKDLERYWRHNESQKFLGKFNHKAHIYDWDNLIARAKAVPIETLLKNPCKRSGNARLTTLCVFHEERTPSLTIFTSTNTFYCFGCSARGDVINFYQMYFGVDFLEAVNSLATDY